MTCSLLRKKLTLISLSFFMLACIAVPMASASSNAWNPEIGVSMYDITLNVGQDNLTRQIAPTEYNGVEIWGQITPYQNIIGESDLALRFGYLKTSAVNYAELCVWKDEYCLHGSSRLDIQIFSIDALFFIPIAKTLSGVLGLGIIRASYEATASVGYKDTTLVSYERNGYGIGIPLTFGIRYDNPSSPFTISLEHKMYTFEDRENSYMSQIRAGYKF